MLSLFRSLTLRYLAERWDRSLLVALSIALGVATLVSSRLLNQYIEVAALDSTVPADVADLYVTNGEVGVPWKVAEELKKAHLPGVSRIEPFVIHRIVLPELDNRPGILLGIDLSKRSEADTSKLRIGFQMVENPKALLGNPVAISRRLYEQRKKLGFKDTDPVQLRYTNDTVNFDLLAVIDIPADSPIVPFADTLVATDVQRAARFIRNPSNTTDPEPRISRVDIFMEKGAPVADIRNQVDAIVSDRGAVRTPDESRKSTQQVIGGIKIVLNLFSLGALVVGLFLVFNALSVTVAERRHDIGVLRSLGATRSQIARLFTMEAMLLGLIGSIPGIPLGVWLSNLALGQFGEELSSVFMQGDAARPTLDRDTAIVAVLAGIATALFASLIPAMKAAGDEPADAVRRAPVSNRSWIRLIHRIGCVLLIGGGIAMILGREYLPARTGALFGASCVLIGMFLAMPILVAILARMLHPLIRSTLGVEARLAADNLIRTPARTGVVIGALAAGVSLMFQTAGVGRSNEVPVRAWLNKVIQADAYVFWGNLASANSSMTPMDPKVRDDLQKIPGVESVVGLRLYRAEFQKTYILVIGIDALDYQKSLRRRLPNDIPALDEFRKLPGQNATVASDNFVERWKLKPGEKVTIPGPKGPVELDIVAHGPDYSWSQGTIFIDRAKYVELFDDPVVDTFHVFFTPDADQAATYEQVRQYAEKNNLMVQTQESVRFYLASILERLFRVAAMQQLIVGVVAALGVVTALLISVLQRRRELGLLRAVGATQMQVLKSVVAEAMLMGILGTILGFVIGLPMEWFLLKIVMREESGFNFAMIIPWQEAIGIGVIAIITATLAGLFPALHAVRLRIPDAIAYE